MLDEGFARFALSRHRMSGGDVLVHVLHLPAKVHAQKAMVLSTYTVTCDLTVRNLRGHDSGSLGLFLVCRIGSCLSGSPTSSPPGAIMNCKFAVCWS